MVWDEFLAAVQLARDELKCSHSGAWYRGVGRYKHRLYPSLFRPGRLIDLRGERDIFLRYGDLMYHRLGRASSWEALVELQHTGTPTRLLDWTETFAVALFFATRSFRGAEPVAPAIWIINPFRIVQKVRDTEDNSIPDFHNLEEYDYRKRFLDHRNWPYTAPMPFRPPKANERVRAQRGFFTVHGTDPRPLDSQLPRYVRQVRLPPALLPDAKRFLELAGVDMLAMFPDAQYFAAELERRYGR